MDFNTYLTSLPQAIQNWVRTVTPQGGVQTPTAFSTVLPYESFVNQNMLRDWGYSQVDPEVQRQRREGFNQFWRNIASTGGQRFGTLGQRQQRLSDQYSRMREEMAQPFYQEGMNRLTDYYNTLQDEYYRDPQAFQAGALPNIQNMIGNLNKTPNQPMASAQPVPQQTSTPVVPLPTLTMGNRMQQNLVPLPTINMGNKPGQKSYNNVWNRPFNWNRNTGNMPRTDYGVAF